MPKVKVPASPVLAAAIETGLVDGDVYKDGETWVDDASYAKWLVSENSNVPTQSEGDSNG